MWSTDRRSCSDTKTNESYVIFFISQLYCFHGLLFCPTYSRLSCVWKELIRHLTSGHWQPKALFTNTYEYYMLRPKRHTEGFCQTSNAKWHIWSQFTVSHSVRFLTLFRLEGHRLSYNFPFYLYVLIYVVIYKMSITCLLVIWENMFMLSAAWTRYDIHTAGINRFSKIELSVHRWTSITMNTVTRQ